MSLSMSATIPNQPRSFARRNSEILSARAFLISAGSTTKSPKQADQLEEGALIEEVDRSILRPAAKITVGNAQSAQSDPFLIAVFRPMSGKDAYHRPELLLLKTQQCFGHGARE